MDGPCPECWDTYNTVVAPQKQDTKVFGILLRQNLSILFAMLKPADRFLICSLYPVFRIT